MARRARKPGKRCLPPQAAAPPQPAPVRVPSLPTPNPTPPHAPPSLGQLGRLVPWAVALSVATIAAIAFVLQARRGDDVAQSLRTIATSGAWAIPAALGLHLLVQYVWCARLRLLAGGLGHPLRWREAQPIITAGLFAAAVTPARIGGEPLRIHLLMRRGLTGAEASLVVLADRALDMAFYLVGGFVAVLLLPIVFGDGSGHIQLLGILGMLGLAGVTAFVALVLWRPAVPARLVDRLARAWDRLRRRPSPDRLAALEAYFQAIPAGLRLLVRRERGRVAAAAALTVLFWSLEFTIFYVLLQGFGHSVSYGAVWVAGLLVVLIAAVPGAPGGTGLAEIAAIGLLSPLAPGLSAGFLIAWRGLTYYVDLLLGGSVAAWLLGKGAKPSV